MTNHKYFSVITISAPFGKTVLTRSVEATTVAQTDDPEILFASILKYAINVLNDAIKKAGIKDYAIKRESVTVLYYYIKRVREKAAVAVPSV